MLYLCWMLMDNDLWWLPLHNHALKKSFDKWFCSVAKGIKEVMCLYLIFKGCFKQFTMINLGVRLYSQKLWALGLTSYAIKSTLIKLLCTDEKLCHAHCHGLRRQPHHIGHYLVLPFIQSKDTEPHRYDSEPSKNELVSSSSHHVFSHNHPIST